MQLIACTLKPAECNNPTSCLLRKNLSTYHATNSNVTLQYFSTCPFQRSDHPPIPPVISLTFGPGLWAAAGTHTAVWWNCTNTSLARETEVLQEASASTDVKFLQQWLGPTNGPGSIMDGLLLFQVCHLNTVHRRAGQEGAESADGRQQLVRYRDNSNRAALVSATTKLLLALPCCKQGSQKIASLPRTEGAAVLQPTSDRISRSCHHCCRKASRQEKN